MSKMTNSHRIIFDEEAVFFVDYLMVEMIV